MVKKNQFKITLFDKILLGITSFLFAFAGVNKFGAGMEKLTASGFPTWFVVLLGLFWLSSAVKIWFKKSRYCALLVSLLVMAGAIAWHVPVDGHFGANLIMQWVYFFLIVFLLWRFKFFDVLKNNLH